MGSRAWILIALTGCGRLAFDEEGSVPPPSVVELGPTTTSLIASFTFDGANTLADDVGGNDAQCQSTTSCQSTATIGALGRGAVFDGTTTCLRVPSLDGWNPPQFTFSAWLDASSMNGPLVIQEFSGACPSKAMKLTNGAVGLVQLNSNDTHNEAWTSIAASPVWHQVAVRWDGAEQQVYVDGTCFCTTTPTLPPVPPVVAEFTLGCYPNEGSLYQGGLDEVRIYERALDPGELAGLYAIDGREAPMPTACSQSCSTTVP